MTRAAKGRHQPLTDTARRSAQQRDGLPTHVASPKETGPKLNVGLMPGKSQ